MHSFLLSNFFGFMVKYASTSGVKLLKVSTTEVELYLPNKKKVQNHIGGVHAIAAAVLAESATGIVFGMNVPDTKLPLLKSMTVNYQRRMQGGLNAVATLSAEQVSSINATEKGELEIPVTITDESGEQPIECIMTWAWVSKKR